MRASNCAASISENILSLARKLASLRRASYIRRSVMLKQCDNCRCAFEAIKFWAKYCPGCFHSLMKKKKCKYCRNLFWGESWKILCFKCWCSGSKANEEIQKDSKTGKGLSPDRIKALIKLVHPDRHQGSLAQLAHDTTCWLLELRERQQEGRAT